jgi:hypothetical protein
MQTSRGICLATLSSLILACSGNGSGASTDGPTGGHESDPGGRQGTNLPVLPPPGPPLSEATVYWVGHSLLDGVDTSVPDATNIMALVGRFAEAQSVSYGMYPHITIGAPLSINWYWRNGQHLPELRDSGSGYDVMVMTEAIPLDAQIEWNASHFFARRFFCAAKRANPEMRVYIYETWHHLYASYEDAQYPPPHRWDWRGRLGEDWPKWGAIADAAATGTGVAVPEDYAWPGSGEDPGECDVQGAVGVVPAGQALGALHDRLRAPRPGESWGDLRVDALFLNGYRDWPESWPLSEQEAAQVDPYAVIAGLTPYDTTRPVDDIHLSALGSYFVALVHYATVYRRSPVGLPALQGVSTSLAPMLQELVWEVVRGEPRTGVAAE